MKSTDLILQSLIDKGLITREEFEEKVAEYKEKQNIQTELITEVEDLKKENTLLKAQNKALTERTDFHEELIAEMAMLVYQ